MKIGVICEHCGATKRIEASHLNRSKRQGRKLFCSRACMGKSRRMHKTKRQRVAEKREYDATYRSANRELLAQKKAAYYKRTRDPERERERRKARMHLHVEYCRQPEYRAKKANYDRRYRAEREFGEFGDAFLVLQDIEREVAARMSRYEVYAANGLLNKRHKRRKADENPLGI